MQLDLLGWPAPCKVLVFPLDKRVGRVRRVAEKLLQKKGFMADAYWRQTVTTLEGQMVRQGIPEAEIDRQLLAFFDAVRAEIIRLSHSGKNSGGAA